MPSNSPPGVRRRKFYRLAFRGVAIFSLLLVIAPALWLVIGVIAKAAPHWNWSVFSHNTTATGGGLENAIFGTLLIMLGSLVVAGTIGIMAGVHLSELSRPKTRAARVGNAILRTATDVLAGFPSILLGFAGYVALVVDLHWGYSLLPAILVVSFMVVPYIAKSTEIAVSQVPTGYRDATESLGMSAGYALRKVTLKSALPGITSGILVALALAGGETAALIYTAGRASSSSATFDFLHHSVPYVTYVVFNLYGHSASGSSQSYLAYDAAVFLLAMVFVLLVIARFITAWSQRNAETRNV